MAIGGKDSETGGSDGRRVRDLHYGQAPDEKARSGELSAAAKRALEEAEQRRKQHRALENTVVEVGGRNGPDPVRYGDWEKGGIASDF